MSQTELELFNKLKDQQVGLNEEISQMFPNYHPQTESYRRLVETGNHAVLPECRNCHDESCLQKGPNCPGTHRMAIKD